VSGILDHSFTVLGDFLFRVRGIATNLMHLLPVLTNFRINIKVHPRSCKSPYIAYGMTKPFSIQ